jgi:hypothetical protein
MLQSFHRVLCGSDHQRRFGSEQILRTLIVQEAIQSREPERQAPAALCVLKDIENIADD